ncbi:hypothetical protein [Wenyingzhuangia marina]|uniref:Antibiotic biosynthesis monooxygenase n=1 Tax=Wenyingzhuangia marina TaxID=1195760 RepID=A0A1M5U1M2_9FLAO|nr:hypothetical protein [Wenyingzhuangia marina]GGF70017.1 hypothetical protein GCM10011397_11170 [Wenyingzhuangia marina]SHH56868.1 hypothetical protein SAMN05444281_0979 [Wenyingzhuangia marina]
MIVSIGEFKLKKLTLLPEFLKLSKQIYKQSQNSKGNIKSQLHNQGIKTFYSFTHWENMEDMLTFVHADFHGKALQETQRLCKEVSFLHYETDDLVDLKMAIKELKNSSGTRVIKYN